MIAQGVRGAATLRRGVVVLGAILLAGCSVLPRPRIPLPRVETRKPLPPPTGNVPAPPADPAAVLGTTEYAHEFCSVVASGNVAATQFHAEKSGEVGLRILGNFASWDGA